MDILLNLDAIMSSYNFKGLRHQFDLVNSNVKGLRSLGVLSKPYSSLLLSVLMNNLLQELHLVVSRDIKDREWELDSLMNVTNPICNLQGSIENSIYIVPTSATLLCNNLTQTCLYCNQVHGRL